MLDCGWDIYFDTALLEPLRAVVKRIDLVLISHPDLEHLGVSTTLSLVIVLYAVAVPLRDSNQHLVGCWSVMHSLY